MEMVDVARVNPDVEEIPVIWAGIVNGVLTIIRIRCEEPSFKGH